jgi:hypothetical protein
MMIENMKEEQKGVLQEEFGDIEKYKEHFMENAGSEKTQKNYKKLVEWYGSKEAVKNSVAHPISKEVRESCQKRIEEVYKKLSDCKEMDVHDFEVRKIIGELDFVSKMIYQMDDVQKLMIEMADMYQTNDKMIEYYDGLYGEGTAMFFGEAIKAFYEQK